MKTFKDFLVGLQENDVDNFRIVVMTNEGDNAGYYILFNSICSNMNRYKNLSLVDFIYKICQDKDDRRIVGMLLNRNILSESSDKLSNWIEYNLSV